MAGAPTEPQTSKFNSDADPHKKRRSRWLYPATVLISLFVGVLVFIFWPVEKIEAPASAPGNWRTETLAPQTLPEPVKGPATVTEVELLDRIAKAAICFGGAPTLGKCRAALRAPPTTRPPPRPGVRKTRRVWRREWAGQRTATLQNCMNGRGCRFPCPLPSLGSKTGTEPCGLGSRWRWLASSIPARSPLFGEVFDAAEENLKTWTPEQTPLTYKLAAILSKDAFKGEDPQSRKNLHSQPCRISRKKREPGGQVGTPLAADPFYVMRALALIPGIELSAGFLRRRAVAPLSFGGGATYAALGTPSSRFCFRSPSRSSGSQTASPCARPISDAGRRSCRRCTRTSSQRYASASSTIKDGCIAQRLLVRSPETTDRIDVAATIAATLARGAGYFVPAYASDYRHPANISSSSSDARRPTRKPNACAP